MNRDGDSDGDGDGEKCSMEYHIFTPLPLMVSFYEIPSCSRTSQPCADK